MAGTGHWSNFVNIKTVREAYQRISPSIHRTPVITSASLDKITSRKVFMKTECFQKTGSFKARGALNAVLKAKETGGCKGVVTHSSGNHGQALAWAARKVGLPCTVVVPVSTSQGKKDAIAGYGATLVECENTYVSRQNTCEKISTEQGYTCLPPFDHYDVIAGQGTMAVELLEQVPELDAILVPCSGGGMTAGIAIAAKAIKPSIKVFACEPVEKGLQPCLEARERLWPNPPQLMKTIAEGIRTQQTGHLTFPILCDTIETKVFSLTDEEMTDAMKFAWQRIKAAIEVSAGAGLAAVMSPAFHDIPEDVRNVGVILCGGNADLDNIPWIKK